MIFYCKGSESDKVDTLSQKINYFNKKRQVEYLILKTNKKGTLTYNYIVLVVIF